MIMQVLADEGVSAISLQRGRSCPPTTAVVSLQRAVRPSREPQIAAHLSRLTSRGRASWRRLRARLGSSRGCAWSPRDLVPRTLYARCAIAWRILRCRDLRASLDAANRHMTPSRRSGAFHHGAVRKHISWSPTGQAEATVRTAFEIARTGRPVPWSSISRRTFRPGGRLPGRGLLPDSGYRRRMHRAQPGGARHASPRAPRHAGESHGRHYAGGGVINGNAAGALTEFATTSACRW